MSDAPAAVIVSWQLVGQSLPGELRAGAGRNIVLGITALFTAVPVINGALEFFA